MMRHFDAHVKFVGKELPAVREFRRHWGWYSHGLSGSSAFRGEINKLDDIHQVREAGLRFFEKATVARAMASVDEADVDYRTAFG